MKYKQIVFPISGEVGTEKWTKTYLRLILKLCHLWVDERQKIEPVTSFHKFAKFEQIKTQKLHKVSWYLFLFQYE